MLVTVQVATCDRKCGEVESWHWISQPLNRLLNRGWTTPLDDDGNQLTICPDCSKKEARPPVDPARGPDRYSTPSGWSR